MSNVIAPHAENVLRDLGMWRLPVCPFSIAREEGIEIAPGGYGDRFDARIEYLRSAGAFCIYHQECGGWRTEGRVRFSVAHELGHFYLPDHRKRLLEGRMHNSVSDFRSQDPFEQQADEFAASLLMPMELFRQELERFRGGFCDLSDLSRLADRLGTSITSTARRYCQCDREPCTIFFSEDGIVRWGISSTDMQYRQMYFYEYGTPVPERSRTAKLWSQIAAGENVEIVKGSVDAHVWFDRPRAEYLWEEVMPLGRTGVAITQLTPEDQED